MLCQVPNSGAMVPSNAQKVPIMANITSPCVYISCPWLRPWILDHHTYAAGSVPHRLAVQHQKTTVHASETQAACESQMPHTATLTFPRKASSADVEETQRSHWSISSSLSIQNRGAIRGLDLLILRSVGLCKIKKTLFLVWARGLRLIHAMVVSCKQCMALEMS